MIIVGLGNPGEEYVGTRHNSGREAVMKFCQKIDLPDFQFDKKSQALVSQGKIGKQKVTLVLPETFMNKSGVAVARFVKGPKAAKKLIVVHDDLDISLGKAKMSWNKSSGGHKGVQSVIKAVGTEAFYRIRIGITPATEKGVLKKPDHNVILDNFIVAKFRDKEAGEWQKTIKKVVDCLSLAVMESPERAMSEYNAYFNR